MKNVSEIFKSFKNHIYYTYGPKPAKMLTYTGVLGWFLSSAAQIVAIAVNKKIPKEQKEFLIPQEIGDGAVNVLSFLVVTSAITALASKLVSTGKIASEPVRKFLNNAIKDKKLNPKYVGNINFDISEMKNFAEIKDEYDSFKKGSDLVGMTIGSILSCNLITPILRNKFATDRQQKALAKMHRIDSNKIAYPKGVSIDTYINMASQKYSSGALRI